MFVIINQGAVRWHQEFGSLTFFILTEVRYLHYLAENNYSKANWHSKHTHTCLIFANRYGQDQKKHSNIFRSIQLVKNEKNVHEGYPV